MPHAPEYTIADVAFDDEHILLTLTDGRVLRTFIKRHIRVNEATPEQRRDWQRNADGTGVNWPRLWRPADEGMVNVWDIEQDALYNLALGRLHRAGWDLDAVPQVERELVALWRMEADINNGGFMQFLCNWGEPSVLLAIDALGLIGAPRTQECVRGMYEVIRHYGETEEMVALNDLYGMMSEAEHDRMQALEEAFWDYPERLDRAVVLYYAPRVTPDPA